VASKAPEMCYVNFLNVPLHYSTLNT